MATTARPGPFATKPTEQLLETAEGTRLNRSVGALDLTALGIGAIIGTGIFVIIGEAIAESGPAIVISFVLAGVTCIFSVLAYAIALLAAFVPLTEIAELVNIGTLFAFFIVNIAVIWLRRTKPDMERGFRVPGVPVVPLVGAALCVYLMTKLPAETWARFGIWLGIGAVLYVVCGYRHSRLRRDPA
jgi:amino acid transporter